MSRLELKDKLQYPLPGTNGRFSHFGTAEDDMGYTYICFADNRTSKLYIEEFAASGDPSKATPLILKQIRDDALFHSLLQFFTDQGCIPTGKPDNPWMKQ